MLSTNVLGNTAFSTRVRAMSRVGTLGGVFGIVLVSLGMTQVGSCFGTRPVACTAATAAADCVSDDLCRTGTCGADGFCDFADVECLTGQECDAADGGCKTPCDAATAATDCDDLNACTDDACGADGYCADSTNNTAACDDLDACTENDACAAGVCAGTALVCDDGLFCDGTETCDVATGCVDGTAPCDALTETCNEDTDACVLTCVVGDLCDDSDACTDDACVDGACANTAKDCDDSVACTDDSCDAATGDCVNADNCTAPDTCNTTTGLCEAVQACTTDDDCVDDGLFCNGIDVCNVTTGVCEAGEDPCAATECGDCAIVCEEGDAEAVCSCEDCTEEILFTTITDINLTGTSGNDVFSAPTVFDAGTFPTFTNGDSAQGLGGADVLNATLYSNGTAVSVTLAGIETLNFTDAGTAATPVNAGNFTDVTNVNSVGSVQIFTMNTIKNIPAFGITNSSTGAALTFNADATVGATDSLTLTLTNATDGAFRVTTTAGTNAGLETISIVSSGTTPNKLTVVDDVTALTTLATVNISGATALTLDLVDDTVTTIDGSTATGAITLGKGSAILTAPLYTALQAAGDLKFVKTGSGNDTIIFGGTLTAVDFDSTTANEGVDAGAGTDTVQMYLAQSLYSTGFAMTGVEVLKIAATADSTVNLAEANVLTSVVNDTNAASNIITLSTCATIPDLTFTGDGVATASQTFDGFTFSFGSGVTTSTSDDMAITVGNRSTALNDTFVYTIGALTIPGVETFTLAISDSPDSTTIGGITATEIKSMTITGTGNVLLGTVGGATTDAMTTFNASALTGRLGASGTPVILDSVASSAAVTTPTAYRAFISLAGSSGSTISLTTGSDDDTIIGSAQADTIISGAGDDTITGGAGADLITPGTGVDTVVFDYSLAGAAVDTITGFVKGASGDKLAVDMSALETAGTSGINAAASDFVELQDASSTVDTDAIVIQELTADAAAVANANVFVLVGATFADTGAVETALETGAFEITGVPVGAAVGDAFLVVYSNGTDAYLAAAFIAVDSGGELVADNLTIVNLAKLSGITSIAAGDFHIANFDFVP